MPIASGILSSGSSSVHSSFEMEGAPPAVILAAAPIPKLSAKNLLSGSAGKAISMTRKAETHKTAVCMTVSSIPFRHLFWAFVQCPALTAKNSKL